VIRNLLAWALPLFMGAIIGYVTNAIAIKMLFRPLKEVKILGIRLPFTPGILPKERHKLASNIGSMVERELFTPEILRSRLQSEDVLCLLQTSIATYTDKILDTPAGTLLSQKTSCGEISNSARFITFALKSLLYSPSLETLVEKVSDGIIDALDRKSLREILGNTMTEKFEQALSHIVKNSITHSAPQILARITPAADKAFSSLTSSLVGFLMKDEIHKEFEVHGRIFLTNAVHKLNVFQRFFISAGQYDKTLREKMPEIIDDLIKQIDVLLQDEHTKKRLTIFFEKSLHTMFDSEKNINQAAAFLMGLLSSYIDEPLADIIKGFNKKDFREVGQTLIEFIRSKGSENFEQSLGKKIDGFIEQHKDVTLSKLITLRAEQKEKIDRFISNKILIIVYEKIDSLLSSINVKKMVSDRIDALDMLRVERIILDIMDNQLKWINVFGAILGAFIGLFQVLCNKILM
jgi:uncharacterized membrane protein YheB (UPF0754 family)